MRVMRRMENPRHHGPITCLCLDRKYAWVVVGTFTGTLSLWDLRFGILIKSWKVLSSKGRAARIHQCVVHPTKGKGKWVVVAVETNKFIAETSPQILLEIWDIEHSTLVETIATRVVPVASQPLEEPGEIAIDEADRSAAAAIAALVRARQESIGPLDVGTRRTRLGTQSVQREDILSPDVRAIVAGTDFGGQSVVHRSPMTEAQADIGNLGRSSRRGFILSGSEDRKMRMWDLDRSEYSSVLSGIETDGERPSYR